MQVFCTAQRWTHVWRSLAQVTEPWASEPEATSRGGARGAREAVCWVFGGEPSGSRAERSVGRWPASRQSVVPSRLSFARPRRLPARAAVETPSRAATGRAGSKANGVPCRLTCIWPSPQGCGAGGERADRVCGRMAPEADCGSRMTVRLRLLEQPPVRSPPAAQPPRM